MTLRTLGLMPVLVFLAGCPPTIDSGEDPGTETDVDTGTASDTGSDSGSDSETDTEPPPVPCSGPTPTTPVTLPYHVEGTDFVADFGSQNEDWQSGPSCSTSAAAAGPEAVFEIELKAGDTLHASETGSMDVTMYLVDGCNVGDTCLAAVDGGSQEILERTVSKDGYYLFVVEGASATATGSYNLSFGISADEICDDGLDNDLDGFTDCEDFGDCFNTVECPGTCPSIVPTSLPYHAEGSNIAADFPMDFDWSGGTDCGTANGHEAIVELQLTAGEVIRVRETGSVDAVVRLVDSCDPTGVTCLGSNDSSDSVDVTIPADGTYYAIVEAWSASSTSSYSFDIGYVLPEVCDDGIDNDLDGYADCGDFDDCFDTPACPSTCPVTGPVTLPLHVSGTDFNADFPNNWPYKLGTDCGAANGNEAVFELALQAGNKLRVQENTSLDTVVRLLDSCNPVTGTCLDSVDYGESFDRIIPVTGTYYAVIEAYSTSASSPYDIVIGVIKPEVCGDGVDNDLDGDIDCGDTDCFGDPTSCSTETLCQDGWDNDADGALDCADTDCAGLLSCNPSAGTIVLTENFDTGIPSTWTVVDGGNITTGADRWTWCDGVASCASSFGFTGVAGGFVYSDSDAGGSGSDQDEQLISPAFDLTGATEAVLLFDGYFDQSYSGADLALVEVSTDGTTWTRVFEAPDRLTTQAPVDLTSVVGSASVQVRFHYLASYDWSWAIDDITIAKR